MDPEVSETCGAEDYGYQIDPDDEPYRLGPCVLPAGHYPETMHEAPQEWPGHPGVKIPNVRWSERQGHSPKLVQGEAGAFDFVPPTSSGLLKLSELVKEGRYYVCGDTNFEQFISGLRYGCMDGHEDVFVLVEAEDLDPVDLLKWIEEHEEQYHQPQDLKIQVPLTQIMTAYAQQAGKSPEEMFPQSFEVPASPYGGVDPSAWDGTVKKYGAPLIPDTPEEYEYGDYSVCSICARGITFGHGGVWFHTHVLPESIGKHQAAPQGTPEEDEQSPQPSFEGTASEVQLPNFPVHGSEGTCANCGEEIRYITYSADYQDHGRWVHRVQEHGRWIQSMAPSDARTPCYQAVFGGPA